MDIYQSLTSEKITMSFMSFWVNGGKTQECKGANLQMRNKCDRNKPTRELTLTNSKVKKIQNFRIKVWVLHGLSWDVLCVLSLLPIIHTIVTFLPMFLMFQAAWSIQVRQLLHQHTLIVVSLCYTWLYSNVG